MLNNEFLNKDSDVVPEYSPLVVLGRKSAIYMAKNGKDTKHTRHIFRRIRFVRNSNECNFHKTLRCEGGLKLSDIATNNIREIN